MCNLHGKHLSVAVVSVLGSEKQLPLQKNQQIFHLPSWEHHSTEPVGTLPVPSSLRTDNYPEMVKNIRFLLVAEAADWCRN